MMAIDQNILIDFVSNLDSAKEIEDCFNALSQSAEMLGFGGVVYTSIPIGLKPLIGDRGPVFLRSESYDEKFLAHYESEDFAVDDFTIKRILKHDLRVIDWWKEQREGALLENEKKVISVAKEDYGMKNGLSIPTLSSDNQIAGASVVSDQKDAAFQLLLSERLSLLKTIIHLFHDRVYANVQFQKVFYAPLLDALSEKEQRVLQFISTGLPLKTIDTYFDICPSYAKNVRAGLYKKLHVKNINQLNYVLGRHRILEML